MATQTQQPTKYDGDLESLNRKAELLQEQIGLYQRLREIELEFNNPVTTAPTQTKAVKATAPVAAPADTVKKAGRPKAQPQAQPNGDKAGAATGDGKSVDLPTLLETIGQQVNKPLTHPDFVTLVREAGYATKAKDFSNMVYQALLKLVKRGTFKKNNDARTYEYIGKAA